MFQTSTPIDFDTLWKGYVNMVQVRIPKLIQNSRMWVEKCVWEVKKFWEKFIYVNVLEG